MKNKEWVDQMALPRRLKIGSPPTPHLWLVGKSSLEHWPQPSHIKYLTPLCWVSSGRDTLTHTLQRKWPKLGTQEGLSGWAVWSHYQCGSRSPLQTSSISTTTGCTPSPSSSCLSLHSSHRPPIFVWCIEQWTWLLCTAEGPYASSGSPHRHSHTASATWSCHPPGAHSRRWTGGCGDLPSPRTVVSVSVSQAQPAPKASHPWCQPPIPSHLLSSP